MRSDNNPAIKQWGRNRKVKLTKTQVAANSSARMRADNPMRRPEVVAVVSAKIKAKGGSHIPKGNKHWRWKGNRLRAQTIRTWLYRSWTRPILERDNFTCQRCKKHGGRLEVHHSGETFAEILNRILNVRQLDLLTEDEFMEVGRLVVEAHASVEGITYCLGCHAATDPQRRIGQAVGVIS